MFLFSMRHNPVAIFRAPDDGAGNGQGGASQTDGAKPQADDTGVTTPKPDEGKKPAEESVTLTKAELEAKLQAEGDKRINSYLNGDKFKTSVSDLVNKALEEERARQKMTAEERKKADEEKHIREINDREARIAERERELKVVDILAETNAPAKLREFITAKDEAAMREQLAVLLSIIDEGVAAKAQDKLKSAAVDVSGQQGASGGDPDTIEYNALMNKVSLNPTESRRLRELAAKIGEKKRAKEGK